MRNSTYCKLLLFLVAFCVFWSPQGIAQGAASADSVGPAFEVGGDVDLVAAVEYQIDASMAFDGVSYLVVWADYRSQTSYDVFAARVASDGSIVDEGGFIISAAEGYQESPAVAFDGTNYLVVWTDMRNGTGDIYASRVDTGGVVLDPGGVAICTEAGAQGDPAIAFDGTNYLVVWTDTRDANENIYGARVDTDAVVLDPGGFAVCTDAEQQRYAAVSPNGAGWLIVWQDLRNTHVDVYGARVNPGGSVLDPGGIAVAATSADETYPHVTYNDTNCLVVWDVDRGATSQDIIGTRVSTSGTVLDPAGIEVCKHVDYQAYPTASTDGSDYLVVWHDARNGGTWDVYGARIDPAGGVIDTTALPVCLDPSQQFGLALAYGGSNWLIAWHDSRNDHKDVFGIRLSSAGFVVDPAAFLISMSSVDQAEPAIAFDGANYLVVWQEWRESTLYDIRATRVTPAGAVLDPAGISVCTHASDALYPAVAFDGANYLVVWQDHRNAAADIYGARITPAGTVLSPGSFPVSTSIDRQECPAAAFNGTNYMVVWQDRRSGGFDIYGARVTPAGSVIDTFGRPISTASRDQAKPSVTSNGQEYFAVWEDARNVYNDVYGARIGQGGGVFDTLGIAISGATLAQEHPDVVFDGDRYAVVWQDRRSSSTYDIYMSRVTTGGLVMDPAGVVVCGAAGDQEEPAITFNGRDYLMIWQDGRGSAGTDIFAARADTSGGITDPDGFEVSGAEHNQFTPDLCPNAPGVVLMAYSSFTSDPGYGSYRIWANMYDVVAAVPGGPAGSGPACLHSNFPNPFRGSTKIRFGLAERAEVALRVYDVKGRLVATLFDGVRGAGVHEVTWEGRSSSGSALAPGLYFLAFRSGSYRQTEKMLLLE